jgi:putative endonuclease
MTYYCYLITTANRTYIGITNNLENRLKKHNQGKGAKSTRCSNLWQYHTIIAGFKGKSDAMRFEWYWKHDLNKKGKWQKTKSGFNCKMERLIKLLMDSQNINLSLYHHPQIQIF